MKGVTGDAAPAVAATLNYLAPGSKRNRLYVALGGHLSTTEYAPTAVRIGNGRPHVGDFGLDRPGFTLLSHRSRVADFGDTGELDRVYVPEACDLVKRATGADEVVSLGWVIRRANMDLAGAQPPAADVRVDMHPGRADARLRAAPPRPRARHRGSGRPARRVDLRPPPRAPLVVLPRPAGGRGAALQAA